ncbi:MerR family transcriptional regulator [Embleya sp. AB8]|uniref:MerR family transcriptional regulator n=1 Tax=Embleya sp. AB8 TaxID=3156304 RepID=UPI003C73D6F2
MGHWSIGKVAAEVGVSAQTLRVWESQGLLVPDRTPGGQRRYTDEHIARARQITDLRRRRQWNPAAIRSSLAGTPVAGGAAQRAKAENLRRARKDRGLTIKELAARADVSPSFLSSVERGESGISTQILARIADALLLPMSALAIFHARSTTVVRSDERARGQFLGGVSWEELVLPGHQLEPALLTVPAGEGSGGPYTRPGESFAFVLAGRMRFVTDETIETLIAEGDAIILPPHTSFAWDNPGDTPARALWVESVSAEAWAAPVAARIVERARPGNDLGDASARG